LPTDVDPMTKQYILDEFTGYTKSEPSSRKGTLNKDGETMEQFIEMKDKIKWNEESNLKLLRKSCKPESLKTLNFNVWEFKPEKLMDYIIILFDELGLLKEYGIATGKILSLPHFI
jgi:hypothetical protein